MRLRLEKVELRLRLENETVSWECRLRQRKWKWDSERLLQCDYFLFYLQWLPMCHLARAETKKHLLLSLAPLRASWQQHSSSEQQLHVMIESRWPSKRPRPSKNEEAESKIEDELWMWFWSEDDPKRSAKTKHHKTTIWISIHSPAIIVVTAGLLTHRLLTIEYKWLL